MSRLRVVFAWGLFVALLGPVPTAVAAEMRVAVLEFSNGSSDAALSPLAKGLQSMITTDLAAVSALKVVERERLKDITKELALSHGQAFDKATAAKLGKLSGATHLLVGSFTVAGESMRLDGRLLVVGTAQVLVAEQVAGEKALFFELEQKLVQKVIASLGVNPAPKERAALQRAHTADFQAFRRFSEGLQAFDDGHLDEAVQALNQAATIDADFKLATLTLAEYERIAAQVRAKASAAGKVEDELRRLEKNKALSAEITLARQLWPLVEAKATTLDQRVRRVAATCLLAKHYRQDMGHGRSSGPLNYEDLAAAGYDDFSTKRMSDALFARAWAEAPEVFPTLPPLCYGLNGLSSGSDHKIEELVGYQIADAVKVKDRPGELASAMTNSVVTGDAQAWLQLDAPGRAKLAERLYALAQKGLTLSDSQRASFEETLAEARRLAGDLDGSTKMYAAASGHTKEAGTLNRLTREIETNKALKQALEGAPPSVREIYLIHPLTHHTDLARYREPGHEAWLARDLQSARAVHTRTWFMLGDLPLWYLHAPPFGGNLTTGPRTTDLRAGELRFDGWEPGLSRKENAPRLWLFSSAVRGSQWSLQASIDPTPPPDLRLTSKNPTGPAIAGLAFGMSRVEPEGGIDKKRPTITIAWAVMLAGSRVRLVQITRNGEHDLGIVPLGEQDVGGGGGPGAGKRRLEVKVVPGSVRVTIDGKQTSFPFKPDRDPDGFAGLVFQDAGYAAISGVAFKAERGEAGKGR